jgi:hypothetical protein
MMIVSGLRIGIKVRMYCYYLSCFYPRTDMTKIGAKVQKIV